MNIFCIHIGISLNSKLCVCVWGGGGGGGDDIALGNGADVQSLA